MFARKLVVMAGLLACDAPAPRAPDPAEAAAIGPALVFVPATGARAPAYTLTASDGTGLRLAFLDAKVVVQGPLALTQLRLAFDNPHDRTIEGRFELTLPDDAAISRFAMKVGESWQEGEVVERLAATQIYESYLHRRVDPALLEHDAGNRFRARVFPIGKYERKELIVTYSEERADPREPVRLPLLGLPRLDALYVRMLVAGEGAERDRTLTLVRRNYTPEGDLTLDGAVPVTSTGVHHGSIVGARLMLVADPAAMSAAVSPAPVGWTVLLDTSASQAAGFDTRVRGLRPLVAALAARAAHDIAIEVVGFDQERVTLYRGPASGFGDAVVDSILARGALGASDPAAALQEVARGVRAGWRVLVVSDGIATVGPAHAPSEAAKQLRGAGVQRIDAIAAGSASDPAALRALVVPESAGSATGIVIPAESREEAQTQVRRLHMPSLRGVGVAVPGSRRVWPCRLDAVQPGDAVMVYAELDEGTPLRVHFEDPNYPGLLIDQAVPTAAIAGPLLERAWHGAQLRELIAQHGRLADGAPRAALRTQIVDLSLAHRVLSPFTAMLVLETEADYRRFQLDRQALADILVVGDDGVEVLRRDLARTLEQKNKRGPGESPTVPVSPQELSTIDSDGDGISDADDVCPMLPEDRDGVEDDDGCPDVLVFDNCQRKLSDKVYFRPRSAELTPKMRQILDEVRDTANAAPDIDFWVDGHADSKEVGTNESSKKLSQRRVDAVIKYLVKAGIDPIRLEPRGMGEFVPIADNRKPEGRAANRRVEFNLKDCDDMGWGGSWRWYRRSGEPALAGRLLAVEEAIERRDTAEAHRLARVWWSEQPGDPLAAVALGRAYEAHGEPAAAVRAYGSLIDLGPSRAELRRHAGQRLEALGAFDLAIDTYRQAAAQRPDHPSSHRLLGLALARVGRHAEACAALEAGIVQPYPPGRFPAIVEILREDLAILGAAWIHADPAARPEVLRRLAALKLAPADAPSLRFVLIWEVDAADVDLHVVDARDRAPRSGVGTQSVQINNTAGYGPEVFVLEGPHREYPYTVEVAYRSRGAMGHALGAVQVLDHDGHGRLRFTTLPFVLMREQIPLKVGVVAAPVAVAGKR